MLPALENDGPIFFSQLYLHVHVCLQLFIPELAPSWRPASAASVLALNDLIPFPPNCSHSTDQQGASIVSHVEIDTITKSMSLKQSRVRVMCVFCLLSCRDLALPFGLITAVPHPTFGYGPLVRRKRVQVTSSRNNRRQET